MYLAPRLVAAGPALGGERGSLPRTVWSFGDGCLMGAAGSVGPAGVTLRFAIARRARGSWATVRELNLAPRRRRAPWLLGTGSEI